MEKEIIKKIVRKQLPNFEIIELKEDSIFPPLELTLNTEHSTQQFESVISTLVAYSLRSSVVPKAQREVTPRGQYDLKIDKMTSEDGKTVFFHDLYLYFQGEEKPKVLINFEKNRIISKPTTCDGCANLL